MYEIIGKRGTGKTWQLITLAKLTDAVIVAPNVDVIEARVEQLGIKLKHKPMSWHSFLNCKKGGTLGKNVKILIDELDWFTKMYCSSENENKRFAADELIMKLIGYTSSDHNALFDFESITGKQFLNK